MEFIKAYDSDSNTDEIADELIDILQKNNNEYSNESNNSNSINNIDNKLSMIKRFKENFQKSLLPDYNSIYKELFNNQNLNIKLKNDNNYDQNIEYYTSNEKPITIETLTGVLETNRMNKLDFN